VVIFTQILISQNFAFLTVVAAEGFTLWKWTRSFKISEKSWKSGNMVLKVCTRTVLLGTHSVLYPIPRY